MFLIVWSHGQSGISIYITQHKFIYLLMIFQNCLNDTNCILDIINSKDPLFYTKYATAAASLLQGSKSGGIRELFQAVHEIIEDIIENNDSAIQISFDLADQIHLSLTKILVYTGFSHLALVGLLR